MEREVIITEDGSKTIRINGLNENYHSSHGALQEAKHVFMKYGIHEFQNQKNVSILEMGFGTGLNAFLTCVSANELDLNVNYHGVEAFPVSELEITELEYRSLVGEENERLYDQIHASKWNDEVQITSRFALTKIDEKLQETKLKSEFYNIVFYDAFGPRVQEEMWSVEIFKKMFESIAFGGFLVTYCAKGQVKRNLREVGFVVEELPGPPGKREMTRAWKK